MKKLFTLAFALVFSTGIAIAQDNNSDIDQVGNGNGATVTQAGADNESTIEQFAQGTSSGQPVAATATVTQTGSNNVSSLDQNAFFGDHEATIIQVGTDNYSAINTQNGGGSAEVYMEGDRNQLVAWDRNTGFDASGAANQKNDNFFALDVLGSDNTVGMRQEFATATVNLEGNANMVSLSQKSSANGVAADYHKAMIDVNGSDNTIGVWQGPDWGASGANNVADVDVLNGSSFNTVDIRQRGSDNLSTVMVDGMNNTATVVQQP
jgi:hypothetical protein